MTFGKQCHATSFKSLCARWLLWATTTGDHYAKQNNQGLARLLKGCYFNKNNNVSWILCFYFLFVIKLSKRLIQCADDKQKNLISFLNYPPMYGSVISLKWWTLITSNSRQFFSLWFEKTHDPPILDRSPITEEANICRIRSRTDNNQEKNLTCKPW